MFIRLISELKNSFKSLPMSIFHKKQQNSQKLIEKLLTEGQEKLNRLQNPSDAMELFHKSIDLCQKFYPKAPLKKSEIQLQIASSFHKLNFFYESQLFLNQAVSHLLIHDQNQASLEIYKQFIIAGCLYLKFKDYLNAEKYLLKGYNFKSSEIDEVKLENINKLIEVKILLGKENEGIELCEEVLQSSKSKKIIENFPWDIYLLYGTCLLALRNNKKATEMFDIAILRIDDGTNRPIGSLNLFETFEEIINIYIKYGLENIAANIALSVGKMKGHPDPLMFYLRVFHSLKPREYLEPLVTCIVNQSEKLFEGSIELKNSYKLAFNFYFKIKKSQQAQLFTEKFIKICEKIGNHDGMIDVYLCLAKIYLNINSHKVKSFIGQAQILVKESPTKEHEYKLNYAEYLFYVSSEDFLNAEKFLIKCIQNYQENVESCQNLVELYLEYSEIYLKKNQTYQAENILFKALSLIKTLNSKDILLHVSILERLGNLYSDQNDPAKGLKYFLEAVKILELSRQVTYLTQISIKSKIMGLCRNTSQISLAQSTTEEIFNLIKLFGDFLNFKEIGYFYIELGMLHEKMLEKIKAKECYLKSKNILNKLNDQETLRLVNKLIENIEV